MAKSVKVHEDTHEALKNLKAQRRSSSIDQVIREMIRATSGWPVGRGSRRSESDELTSYLKD